MEEKLKLPNTCCVMIQGKVVACDKYLRSSSGTKDFHCCETCGWNPPVSEKRIAKIREQMMRPKKVGA